jgi:hypothetical protein
MTTDTQQRIGNLKAAFAEHGIPWPNKKTLFWHPTGPLVSYIGGMLVVSDLNPENNIRFRMSRKEILKFGWRCIRAGLAR